jgi:zinc transport system substrate-binding protein
MNSKSKKKIIFVSIFLIVIIAGIFAYLNNKKPFVPADNTPFVDAQGRLIVVTSLFPVYDFAKIVGGDKASVSLILPPNSEAHSFKPLSKDIDMVKKAALFFYTSELMEPWAPDLASEVTAKTKVLSAADGLNDNSLDPHVWLDFTKASQMVDAITSGYKLIDPGNADYYQGNADSYKEKLKELDNKFSAGLKNCKFSEFISGGHSTFAYLAKHYNLKYDSVQSFIPDDSRDNDKLVALGQKIKASGQPYIYYEELSMPILSEVLHQLSGAKIMPLNAAHNVGKYDVASGVTFISLMENDLNILQKGLVCY